MLPRARSNLVEWESGSSKTIVPRIFKINFTTQIQPWTSPHSLKKKINKRSKNWHGHPQPFPKNINNVNFKKSVILKESIFITHQKKNSNKLNPTFVCFTNNFLLLVSMFLDKNLKYVVIASIWDSEAMLKTMKL